MLQVDEGVLLYTDFLFLIKSDKKLPRVEWLLFKSKISEKKSFRVFNLVTLQHQRS